MATVGWVGLGKLGMPCALALERTGQHHIVGYDTNPDVRDIIEGGTPPRRIEAGLADLLKDNTLELARSIPEVAYRTDGLIFVAVQTPHSALYGGAIPVPDEPRDFDYTYLCAAVQEIGEAAVKHRKRLTVVIVSTVLPGTIDRYIRPLLNPYTRIVYNPFFIAMGTTVRDFCDPEFVLMGLDPGDGPDAGAELAAVYSALHNRPIHAMSIRSAELTKVIYNTYISMKIVFANTVMEIAHKVGADCDDVTDALQAGSHRIISGAYLRGGMGDGGACHPRDNIAMSWLARRLNLSVDPFEFVTRAREAQAMWLAQYASEFAEASGYPIVVLGKAYKPASDLTYGSPALLLAHFLRRMGHDVLHYDPYVPDGTARPDGRPGVYIIGTRHPDFASWSFPGGSIVIDPHRYIPRDGRHEDHPVTIIPVGH